MAAADSLSHHVYIGLDVVVKVIDAARHSRLDREIALAPHLPAGLTASLLASGHWPTGTPEVRYACYARVPGTAPGSYLAFDLRLALERPATPSGRTADRLRGLEELIAGRRWWHPGG